MTTLNDRLLTLEQLQRKARPELVLLYRTEQEGEPTPEQATQIAQAKSKAAR